MGRMKPPTKSRRESRGIKQTIAITPTEARAIKWFAKRYNYRGLAPLRDFGIEYIVGVWTGRTR